MPGTRQWVSRPLLGTPIASRNALCAGLVDAWPTNERYGSSINSAGPTRTTGTLNSSVTWGNGRNGSVLSFASGGVVTTAGSTYDWDRTQPWSFGFWVSASTSGSTIAVLTTEDSASNFVGMGILILTSRVLRIQINNNTGAGNQIAVNTTTTLTADTLYHLVVTYDGSSAAAGLLAYINGVPDTMTSVADSLSASSVSTVPLRMGLRNNAANPLVGSLSDIYSWSRVLTFDEVQALYGNSNQVFRSRYRRTPLGGATTTYFLWNIEAEEDFNVLTY